MRHTWKSSTALITSLSLALPVPLAAQTESIAPVPEFLCFDGSNIPCAEGVEQIPTSEMICEDGAELPCAADVFAVPVTAMICEDGAELPCAEGVVASLRPEMADLLTAMRENGVAPEIAEALQDVEPVSEDVPAVVEAEAAPAEDAAVAEEAEQPVEEQAQTAETSAESEPVSDVAQSESTDAGSGEAITAETVDADTSAEETAETVEVEAMEAAEAAVAEATEAAEAAEVAEATEADEATVAAEAAEATEAAEFAEALEAAESAEAEPAVVETAEAEPVPELPVQPEAESGAAPVAAAADAPMEVDATSEVTEEIVTEDTARSSDEDFANKVNETAEPATAGVASSAAVEGDDGLSKGEKAILLGLGAIAVGAILSNNREVALNSGDRVVVSRDDGSFEIIKDDNALLRQPGSALRTETFDDGSTRTIVTREDGSKIVTIRDAEYRVLRRLYVAKDGTETMLIDDTVDVEPVDITTLPAPAVQLNLATDADEEALRDALAREFAFDRRFSLAQIRHIPQVRALVPVIDLDLITFETGSAAIRPDQARSLARLGRLIQSYVADSRNEVFLIEGHTDAVGSAAYNLALSDRRAESVALALTEYFDVPPENLVVQGYGEEFLKIKTDLDERANRRASVRRITHLLRQASN